MATENPWATGRVFGVLTSQIGYEPDGPIRVLVRCDDAACIADDTACRLVDATSPREAVVWSGDLGEPASCWGDAWWAVTLPDALASGTYRLEFLDAEGALHRSDDFDVRPGILWDASFERVALDSLERRAVLAEAKTGWMDAGTPWQEANAHGSMLVGLLDVLEAAPERMTDEQRRRLETQVVVGCDYQKLLQETAKGRGLPAGSISHMVPRFEHEALPADASKAAVSWAMAARLMPEGAGLDRADALDRAAAALEFAASEAAAGVASQPGLGFNRHQRGLPDDYAPPPGEHPTRELWALCWAAVELGMQDRNGWLERAVGFADEAMARQATEAEAIHGLCGFFFEFGDRHHAEPAWAHQIKARPLGADAGASFPHYVLPLILLLRHTPDHPRAAAWRSCLDRFVQGFLLPACASNPFGLLPNLLHRDEGLVCFAGPWHGMSCIYTLTAGLALELHRELYADAGDDRLVDLATANLQWVAGLNAGLTRNALRGCVLYDADVPEGAAWPVSLIHKVGRRTAGTWTNIRGSVCGGFVVGKQFEFDAPATAASDGPHQFTDEEWLPFAAGWLSGLARWERHRREHGASA